MLGQDAPVPLASAPARPLLASSSWASKHPTAESDSLVPLDEDVAQRSTHSSPDGAAASEQARASRRRLRSLGGSRSRLLRSGSAGVAASSRSLQQLRREAMPATPRRERG